MNYINNAWITSTAIMTAGMLTNTYLNAISKLQHFYIKKNYITITNDNDNNNDNDDVNDTDTVTVNDDDDDDKKLANYYSKQYIFTYIIAITSIATITTIATRYKK